MHISTNHLHNPNLILGASSLGILITPHDRVLHVQEHIVQEQHQEEGEPVMPLPLQEVDDAILRRSTRIRMPAISSEYVVYLAESDYDVCDEKDPTMFSQPMESHNSNLYLDALKDEMNSMADNQNISDQCLYHKVSGSKIIFLILYVDDILFATNDLGLLHESIQDLTLLLLLAWTKDFMLTYRQTDNLKIVGYSNSDLAGCVDSRKSMTKQSLVATSTMEPEFISCFEATSQGVWLKNFISELKIMDCISWLLRIYCDNSTVVFMAKNNRSSSQSKHIDIKYLAIKDRVRSNEVQIEHISTKQMIANPLTKGMPLELFKDHVTSMGLCSITSLI
ncbi:hypothetical protein AAHE18_09G140400 [Arachis hypogaea]